MDAYKSEHVLDNSTEVAGKTAERERVNRYTYTRTHTYTHKPRGARNIYVHSRGGL